jgi:two-component sensor histidine kinase
VLNELISNVLKHAFPDGRSGEMSISLHATREGEKICGYAMTVLGCLMILMQKTQKQQAYGSSGRLQNPNFVERSRP